MSRILIKSIIFSLVIVFAGLNVVYAQTAPVTGKVELLKADGIREPVVGALVEPFRMDIKASAPSAKTNSKGEFSFAGMQVGATFFLAVSGPNISPTFLPNVRAGQERLLITVNPGDGTRLKEDEVRQGAAAAKAGTAEKADMTAAQKKAQAEFEGKVAEVKAKNEKAEKVNEIVNRVVKEGEAAFKAKNWELAIVKFDEGANADPEFVGSAPVFLMNKGLALTERAIENHNKAVRLTDPTEKAALGQQIKSDLVGSVNSFQRGWNVLTKAQASDIPDKGSYDLAKVNTLRSAAVAFRRAVEMQRVDPSLIDAAKILLPEYVNTETDAERKLQARLTLADLYRIAEDRENAVVAYKKVLETSPDNPDALAYAGIVLVDLGWLKDNDKELSQEGANYLQKFVSIAPDSHALKSGAVEYLNILKEQSIIPVKPAPARRRP
ncbi:hypothetical protein BH20ACI2_BH20ACI2_11280 [soil metagenome]